MSNKKNLLVRNNVGSPHYKVIYEGGGELPKELTGLFTSEKEANKAISAYLQKRDKVDASNTSD